MTVARVVDHIALKHALDDLAGVAVLLLDASRFQDPEQAGVTTAARLLEIIHNRLEQALGMEAGR